MFKINRWDVVMTGDSDLPKPLVYFHPNLDILDHARKNNYKFRVDISGTKIYDGTVWAIMDKSSVVPNCRPNFFEATNLYVLTLLATWNGYPPSDGSFTLNNQVVESVGAPVGSKQSTLQSHIPVVDKVNNKGLLIGIGALVAILIVLAVFY